MIARKVQPEGCEFGSNGLSTCYCDDGRLRRCRRLPRLIAPGSATGPMISAATPAPSGVASAPRAASRPSYRSSTGACGPGLPGGGNRRIAPAQGAASGSTLWTPCGMSAVSCRLKGPTHDKDAVKTGHQQVMVQLTSLVHVLLGRRLHQRVQEAEVNGLLSDVSAAIHSQHSPSPQIRLLRWHLPGRPVARPRSRQPLITSTMCSSRGT